MNFDIKQLSFKLAQYAIIENDHEQILVLERKRSKTWSLPGGRLERSFRNPLTALRREIKEELNLFIICAEPMDVSIIQDKYQTKYCVYFLVDIKDLTSLKLSSEYYNFKWVGKKIARGMRFEDKMISKIIYSVSN